MGSLLSAQTPGDHESLKQFIGPFLLFFMVLLLVRALMVIAGSEFGKMKPTQSQTWLVKLKLSCSFKQKEIHIFEKIFLNLLLVILE